MLTNDQVSQFKSRGFLKSNRLLNDPQIEELREELARVVRDKDSKTPQPFRIVNLTGNPDAPVWQIVNIWEASEPYRRLVFNTQLVEEVAQLSGTNQIRIWHDQIQFKPAVSGGVTAWHQDHPYWDIIQPASQVTAWVALDDADEDNGCMSMVPGSHLWGNQIRFLETQKDFNGLPSRFEDHALEVCRCPVRKGEVHFHHALTWHGSHANKSGRPRRALAMHYMTEDTRFMAGGIHPLKPRVKVADGEKLQGEHFPVVWKKAS